MIVVHELGTVFLFLPFSFLFIPFLVHTQMYASISLLLKDFVTHNEGRPYFSQTWLQENGDRSVQQQCLYVLFFLSMGKNFLKCI